VSDASNLGEKPFKPEVLEAFSHVIVTAVEGGSYTRDDYKEWTQYAHADGPFGFQAAVTVYPNKVGRYAQDAKPDPVRVTAEWFAKRILTEVLNSMSIYPAKSDGPLKGKLLTKAVLLLVGDEDVAGDVDVIDAGALLQIAVYGDVIYG
jgi:hypothetical protein